MKDYHLAQVNIAKMLAPMDDPIMQDFVNNVERINALADKSDGFIWRMQNEDKEEGARVFEDGSLLINISVWKDLKSLFDYTYNSGHIEVLKRKKEWFKIMKFIHMAFWYVPTGHKPEFQEAKDRLDYLRNFGETPYAFSFKNKYSLDDFINYKALL